MAFGPGKYDDELTEGRRQVQAEGALLLIIGGTKGSGFSAHLSLELMLRLQAILREVARQIEEKGPDA
jgi:hypothetical protein